MFWLLQTIHILEWKAVEKNRVVRQWIHCCEFLMIIEGKCFKMVNLKMGFSFRWMVAREGKHEWSEEMETWTKISKINLFLLCQVWTHWERCACSWRCWPGSRRVHPQRATRDWDSELEERSGKLQTLCHVCNLVVLKPLYMVVDGQIN